MMMNVISMRRRARRRRGIVSGLVGVLVGGSLVLGAMPVCLSYSKGADLAKAAAPYVAVRAQWHCPQR